MRLPFGLRWWELLPKRSSPPCGLFAVTETSAATRFGSGKAIGSCCRGRGVGCRPHRFVQVVPGRQFGGPFVVAAAVIVNFVVLRRIGTRRWWRPCRCHAARHHADHGPAGDGEGATAAIAASTTGRAVRRRSTPARRLADRRPQNVAISRARLRPLRRAGEQRTDKKGGNVSTTSAPTRGRTSIPSRQVWPWTVDHGQCWSGARRSGSRSRAPPCGERGSPTSSRVSDDGGLIDRLREETRAPSPNWSVATSPRCCLRRDERCSRSVAEEVVQDTWIGVGAASIASKDAPRSRPGSTARVQPGPVGGGQEIRAGRPDDTSKSGSTRPARGRRHRSRGRTASTTR